MANEKVFQSRIQLKHDIEENWSKATNFVPKVGEIIIYDIDENNSIARFKIGDGITNVNSLPFVSHHEVISYLPQDLTEEQKAQARENIGAGEPQIQADWNQNDETATDYIKNKTHYDTRTTKKVTYRFDGKYFDTWEGEKVDLNGDGTMYYLKLSDDVPSITDFVGCTQIVVDDGVLTSTTITEDNTDWYADAGHGIYATVAFVLVTETIDNFPMSPGLWAICKFVDGVVVSYTVQASYKKVIGGELKKIDKKYLPEYITDEELLNILIEESIIDPLSNANNEIYTDKNGKIYVL